MKLKRHTNFINESSMSNVYMDINNTVKIGRSDHKFYNRIGILLEKDDYVATVDLGTDTIQINLDALFDISYDMHDKAEYLKKSKKTIDKYNLDESDNFQRSKEATSKYNIDKDVNWKIERGVVVFDIAKTTYTLYKDSNNIYELYKYDDDNGPLIMRFKIDDNKMYFYYGGFDKDTVSSAYSKEIVESIFNYFNLPSEDKGFDNINIVYQN